MSVVLWWLNLEQLLPFLRMSLPGGFELQGFQLELCHSPANLTIPDSLQLLCEPEQHHVELPVA